ncbi:MAG: class I mannose-6-phosphate isomerase, partial [Acidobacteriaceae bacterium]|nr:class I mannose-6-phosphate isomerase [Acidobacteriaceae bacterium]
MSSNYDKHPYISISSDLRDCICGWESIAGQLRTIIKERATVCVECYPGVFEEDIERAICDFFPEAAIVRARDYLKPSHQIEAMLCPDLSEDPVFGWLTRLELKDFFRPGEIWRFASNSKQNEPRFVIGTGAAIVAPDWDVLIYADLARWEIQHRQRNGRIGNIGSDITETSAAEKYKRGYFVDWRVADRLKARLLPKIDFLLDTTDTEEPKMISGEMFRRALAETVNCPFRVQPFFDPGPWGGQWMREVCDLPDGPPNYAWCFDCVPEENSLVFGFGSRRVEVPAIDLVLSHPRELLGEAVHARFGTEFPIRFDFLDTMQGGNLSLQVHPLTEYIQQHFGMHYTQDESYYLLDAGEDACVYLGLRENINRDAMIRDLQIAQTGGAPFPAGQYVNQWPARPHDHFLIPAGTIHCSGRNSMVLEISATPYIFTFKLWDWDRLGLDGRPRPIHLEHGISNIQWDRTTEWVRRELVNRVEIIGEREGWREERTGLHQREFIETRRHWFTGPVLHDTADHVNVLNLVEGSEAIVESPTGKFSPFVVHYAETFIVPAAVGQYTVKPSGDSKRFATI